MMTDLVGSAAYPILAGGRPIELDAVDVSRSGATHRIPVVSIVEIHETGLVELGSGTSC